ncbi:hypothetical protein PHMEG_00010180 [Phytophthora megakarya]|uniref:ATP-dependent DNA helicase n=1 Tax=Phytophthora megakarya TaxID=4795 RepID=A0A225WFB3_9STRA|nr:hypothetical protein PHMEG_00010180 [Phytophthora megakarya]
MEGFESGVTEVMAESQWVPFAIAMEQSRLAFSVPYTPLSAKKTGPAKLLKLQQRYKDVHLVIIDEFSVISCGMLYWIDHRMREIWPSHRHLPFGGRDVIFTGDSAQLDPVVPYSLSTPADKILNDVHRKGREIWERIDRITKEAANSCRYNAIKLSLL